MIFKSAFFVLVLILFTSNLFAINEDAGTRGFTFMKVPYSARAMGMANAFTGLANDGDAVFFNTAGLAQVGDTHFKTTYINYIDGLQGGSLVYSTQFNEEWKVAPFAQFLASGNIPRTRERDGQFEGEFGVFGVSSILAGVGFARTMHPALDFGFNVKVLYEKLDSYSASAIAADFAILHQTNAENLKVGITLRNFGAQLTYYTEQKYEEGLPTMVVAGASYKFPGMGFLNFDLIRPLDNDFFFRLGLEYHYNTYLSLRAGLDSRMDDYRTGATFDFMSGLSFGAGFNWNRYIVDYAVSSMGSLGLVNQISISYKF